jgi:hypothetical protein
MRVTFALVALLGCQADTAAPEARDGAGCLELSDLEPFVADIEGSGAMVQDLILSNSCSGPTTLTDGPVGHRPSEDPVRAGRLRWREGPKTIVTLGRTCFDSQ